MSPHQPLSQPGFQPPSQPLQSWPLTLGGVLAATTATISATTAAVGTTTTTTTTAAAATTIRAPKTRAHGNTKPNP